MPILEYTSDSNLPRISNHGAEDFSTPDILLHSIAVGNPGIFTAHNYSRPLENIRLRIAFIYNGIDLWNQNSNSRFQQNSYFPALDGSEKTPISYALGMTQCSMMAERLFNAAVTVHLDAVYNLLTGTGIPRGCARPDLLAYTTTPRSPHDPCKLIMEAKGRSRGYSSTDITEASRQFSSIPPTIAKIAGNAQEVISISHFAYTKLFWRNHLTAPHVSRSNPGGPGGPGNPGGPRNPSNPGDPGGPGGPGGSSGPGNPGSPRNPSNPSDPGGPGGPGGSSGPGNPGSPGSSSGHDNPGGPHNNLPPSSRLDRTRDRNIYQDDPEFGGLLLIAQLLPFSHTISNSSLQQQHPLSNTPYITGTTIPGTDYYVGLPAELNALLKTIDSPLERLKAREKLTTRAWSILQNTHIGEAKSIIEARGYDATATRSGLIFARASS